MATVNKDFKIKSGLIVEGLQGTINGEIILTENAGDQYILDLIGGETLVKSVSNEFDVSVGGELSLDRAVVDAYYDAAGSAATAQGNAEDYADGLAVNYDAAGAAGAVASDLSDHISDTSAHGVDGAVVGTTDTQTLTNKTIGDTLNFTGAGAMTINSDSHIVLTPASGSSVKWGSDILATQAYADAIGTDLSTHESDTSTHGVTGDIVGTTDTQTISNKTLGSDLAAGGYKVSGLADPSADQDSATKAYVDGAISDLVNGAPALLDTLNELAAAINNDEGFSGTIATSIGEKVSKAGDSMTGDLDFGGTHKVTSLATPTSSSDAATKGYVDGEISTLDTAAQGYASTAQGNAEDYADGLAVNYDPAGTAAGLAGNYDAAGSAATALQDAKDYADALDTDDVSEGMSNQYFTDGRAKSSAADLLTGANLTNITITGTGAGLTITAENGVADSDTDDLDEGTTNLYFTDVRAVDALEAVVPNFTAVELNSVAKQVAATLSAPTAGIQVAHAFAKADYRSAEYLVKVAYGTHTEISKVLLTLDSSDNIAITEYGIVGTNGSASSISAGISGANVQLQVTTANNNSTVTVMGTLLK